jgi:hypothetical protein
MGDGFLRVPTWRFSAFVRNDSGSYSSLGAGYSGLFPEWPFRVFVIARAKNRNSVDPAPSTPFWPIGKGIGSTWAAKDKSGLDPFRRVSRQHFRRTKGSGS